MTEVDDLAAAPKPAFWYGIPHGYRSMDLTPSAEHLEAVTELVRGLPEELRERANHIVRFYAGVVRALNAQHAVACLVGMHPNEEGEPVLSVITLSVVPSSGANPALAVADLAGSAAERPEDGIVPMELPTGVGFLAEQVRRTPAPGKPPEGSDEPLQGTMWQGTIAVPAPDSADVIVMQLVTPAVDQSEDYRNILIGFAHTLSFTDPMADDDEAEDDTPPAPGSAAAAVQSDFG